MTIFIGTSGGGIVLIIVGTLILSRGSGLSGTLAAVLLGPVLAVVLAVIIGVTLIVCRLLSPREPATVRPVVVVSPVSSTAEIPHHSTPALSAPVRLPQDQLEQLIRRQAEQ
jgi:drug/metabolite transporter (DMT)-like permease